MKRFRYYLLIGALVLVAAMTSSCQLLFPEKLDATVWIQKDGTYSVSAKGVFTEYFARTAAIEEGGLPADQARALAELEEALKSDPAFREVEFKGDEQFYLRYRDKGVLRSKVQVFGSEYVSEVLTITPLTGGRVEIKTAGRPETDEDAADAKKTLSDAGMGMDWRIRVKTDADVIEHNAASTPWLFGLIGSYEWRVSSPSDPLPYMLIQTR